MATIAIKNDFGNVLINDEFSCHCLAKKEKLTTVLNPPWFPNQVWPKDYNAGSVAVTTTSQIPPMVAVANIKRPNGSDGVLGLTSVRRVGNTWEYRFVTGRAEENRGTSADVYIFDVPQVVGGNGVLQLFNASRVKVFDSDLKYSRVQGSLGKGQSMAVPAGRTYAAAIMEGRFNSVFSEYNQDYTLFWDDDVTESVVSASASAVTLTEVLTYQETGADRSAGGPGTWQRTDEYSGGIERCLVLDVTGF